MIPLRTTLSLGVSQLVSWGVTYYLIGAFGELIVEDLGWRRVVVYGGFSVSLIVMGLLSPMVGRLIDRHGGRQLMAAGSALSALACVILATSRSVPAYYTAWILLGVSMRFTLYEAAFASLTWIGGLSAKGAISRVTFLGGLASTVFWPLGHALADAWGWRVAVAVYAALALLVVPLNLMIPKSPFDKSSAGAAEPDDAPLATSSSDRLLAGALYATVVTLATFLNSAMSAHMIEILSGLGLALAVSVWVAALRGVGQVAGRAGELFFGQDLYPLGLNLAAALVLPLCFIAALGSGASIVLAIAFTFFYGAANGVMTITRGTMPLILFDRRGYGSVVGYLLVPSFFVSAAAPIIFAYLIDRGGGRLAVWVSIGVAVVVVAAAATLRVKFGPRR